MNSKDSHELLPEQAELLAEIKNSSDNLMIEFPAGGSKTFILVKTCHILPVAPTKALAFNKSNAVDLVSRVPSHITVETFNALGHGAWGRRIEKRLNLSMNKTGAWVKDTLKAHKLDWEQFSPLRAAIDGARILSMVPENVDHVYGIPLDWDLVEDHIDEFLSPQLRSIAEEGLRASISAAFSGTIDFSDQIYMSVCFGGVFPKFPLLLVDESQDMSAANLEMIERSLKPGGRIIAVGDRFQGIYAFRGASSEAIPEMISRFKMRTLTADTTFRCATAICTAARFRHPRIKPFRQASGKITHLEQWSSTDLHSDTAVLCRNNAPLMGLALKLLRQGRGANYIGNDLSKPLMAILSKLGPDSLSSKLAEGPLNQWKTQQIETLFAKRPDASTSRIEDKFQCLNHLLAESPDIGTAKAKLAEIFLPSAAPLTLATIHKSKGFEWTTVVFLDSWRIPSKYAREAAQAGDDSQLQQELNLRYVAITRAKDSLIFANLDQFQSEH